MKTQKYYLTNAVAIDRNCAVKLAELSYDPGSNRPDDCGVLYVAPITQTTWEAPLGLLALFATTNGDSIYLGQIEDGELTWIDENDADKFPEHMRDALARAVWNHPNTGEGYSYLVQDSIPDRVQR